MRDMIHLRPVEAARLLGVSTPTLKQWIYRGKIRSVRTPGGHHRIPRREIARLSIGAGSAEPREAVEIAAISGRNKLLGTVTNIQVSGLLAEVTLDIGGQELTSLITRGAVRSLGLRRGSRAYALVKATEVMMIRA